MTVYGKDSGGNCVSGPAPSGVTASALQAAFTTPITIAQVYGVDSGGNIGRGVVSSGGSETANSALDTATVDMTVGGALGRQISANVKISGVSGNSLITQSDGLYVPPVSSSVVNCAAVQALYSTGTLSQLEGANSAAGCVKEEVGTFLQRMMTAAQWGYVTTVAGGAVTGLQLQVKMAGQASFQNLPGLVIPLEEVRDCNNNLLGYFVKP